MLTAARRVVVKAGSSLLVDDLASLHGRGQQPVLVSSGAMALGRSRLALAPGRLKL